MSAANQQIHARLSKYDEATHVFEALATDETIDHDKERMHYDTSKTHFVDWSESQQKATAGKSVGNLRAMHGKVAAGILTSLICDDAARSITISGEIVDPVEQRKMLKGVYSGVSIGASVLKTWDDPDNAGVKFYTAKPFEVSLVDLPANPNARFKVHKADGGEIEVEFEKTQPVELTDAEKAAKAVADANEKLKTLIADPVEAVRILEEAAKVYATKAAETAKTELVKSLTENPELTVGEVQALALKHVADADREGKNPIELLHRLYEVAGLDEETRKKIAAETTEVVEPAAVVPEVQPHGSIRTKEDLEKAIAAVGDSDAKKRHVARCAHALKLADLIPEGWRTVHTVHGAQEGSVALKGMYQVGQLAGVLDALLSCADSARYEADFENDSSPIPARLRMIAEDLGEALCEMCEEETREAANKVTKADMRAIVEKAGARHSKADLDRLQAIHDHSIGMGANCAASEKMVGKIGATVLKALGVEREEDVEKAITSLREDADKFRKTPVRKAVIRSVEKGQLLTDETDASKETAEEAKLREKAVRAESTDDLIATVKLAQRRAYSQ